ncbi:MAG TPA: hypothetical protein VGT44_07660 [Ktedonobacteraceae bacterium]|nr:hypothetical protein [Ktedonobacteraceae bacterium]
MSGLHIALREDEGLSLIFMKTNEESATALARVAQRIRQHVRQSDAVLLGERECAIILPRTSLASAQAVARRVALLLVDIECEIELLYGPAAYTLIQRLQSSGVIVAQREEVVDSFAYLPALTQTSDPSLPYLAFLADYPSRRLFRLFPYDLACQYQCFPVGAERDMLTVGTRERLDENVVAHFKQVTKRGIFQVRCEERLIDSVLRYWQRLFEVEAMFN